MDHVFDYETGNSLFPTSSNVATMDTDGNLMMLMSDNMVMDMDSGEVHMTSGWGDSSRNSIDEEDDF